MASSAWKIKVGVELDTSGIESALGKYKAKDIKINAKVDGADEVDKLSGKIQDAGLSYQQYRMILDTCVDATKMMAGQTIKLNSAQTELIK